ncbi:TrgA family protein [Phaeovulum sp.]|uniref:TrgA family protein n=1 Tax=Phaeovulum sp. TaxID=2934796 RepID=UPI0039E295BF
MPTAAKLFAALVLAATGVLAAALVLPDIPYGAKADFLPVVGGIIGFSAGWFVVGMRTGKGNMISMQTGMRGALFMVIGVLVVSGFAQMIKLALRKRYDAPTDALVDVVGQGLEFGKLVLQADVLGVLIVGGALSGMAAEWAGRRWR